MQYLQKLQNKGIRIILRCNYRKNWRHAWDIASIKERIEYNVRILIHKMINGDCPGYLKKWDREEGVQTRSEGIYTLKDVKLERKTTENVVI